MGSKNGGTVSKSIPWETHTHTYGAPFMASNCQWQFRASALLLDVHLKSHAECNQLRMKSSKRPTMLAVGGFTDPALCGKVGGVGALFRSHVQRKNEANGFQLFYAECGVI